MRLEGGSLGVGPHCAKHRSGRDRVASQKGFGLECLASGSLQHAYFEPAFARGDAQRQTQIETNGARRFRDARRCGVPG